MQRVIPTLAIVAVLSALPVHAAEPTRADVDKAIEKALVFLSRTQDTDGSWKLGGTRDPAATSLAVMAFLSAGHVPGEGIYGDKVERGIRWVLKVQLDNGLIATNHGNFSMYQHGISTLMLAEAAGMCEGKLAEEVRKKLENAIKLILDGQRAPGKAGAQLGGWRYAPRSLDSDMSVTGWQLMSLRAAKNLGCDVPQENIDLAVQYIKRSQAPDGGFRYQPGGHVTVACTGTGTLSLELCGKAEHRSRETTRAAAYLLEKRNRLTWHTPNFFYTVYYCSQAMFQVGGNEWKSFRPDMQALLLQHQSSNGAWDLPAGREQGFGPNYGTAMSVLALTVEYRYLPIYQRGEEPTEKR